jgi:ABC-type sugar transport system ATPase subunit
MDGAIKRLDDIAIDTKNLTKLYGEFCAINDLNLTVKKGEIHSVVGQNGAGKSTLLGILSGRVTPSSGNVHLFGEQLHYGDPRYSRKLGLAMIYQELTISPNLSALENVFLGQNISRMGFVSRGEMNRKFEELCHLLNVNISPRKIARDLSVADQQVLEIMRGLSLNAKIIVLDEPTASLAPPERRTLLDTLKSLRDKGITIVYVSHHLEEVIELSDNITVLRNGEKISTLQNRGMTKDSLVAVMLGEEIAKEVSNFSIHTQDERRGVGLEVLRAENITVPGSIDRVNLHIQSGEIVGIGGLVGSGRSTLARALAGLESKSSGELWIQGKKVKWPRTVRHAIRHGIALAPEDRKHQGLVLGMSCRDNINMVDFRKVKKFGLYRTKTADKIASTLAQRFGLTRPVDTTCGNLSGGNQQKVLLSKVCNLMPKVLIVDEPTRGIDIGVKMEVLKILRKLANEGMSIIVISSELEEVVAVSDRVLVMSKGRLVNELRQKDRISVENILQSAFSEVDQCV